MNIFSQKWGCSISKALLHRSSKIVTFKPYHRTSFQKFSFDKIPKTLKSLNTFLLPKPCFSKASFTFYGKVSCSLFATGLGFFLIHLNKELLVIQSYEKTGPSDLKPNSDINDPSSSQDEKSTYLDACNYFDWTQLSEILRPYWHHLLMSLASVLVVALINVKIPSLLGQLVDIITTQFIASNETSLNTNSATSRTVFTSAVKRPVFWLLTCYIVQAVATFNFIFSLSIVGEELAAELRRRLFRSMLNQDIEFYDNHMAGDIITCLTNDVQEFKSNLKLCWSQGIRSASQAAGSIVSLYMISPEMTTSTVIVIPLVLGIGSLLGQFLRKLSKKAQSKLLESTALAEEALRNIRTVRSFAMEKQEYEMYCKEMTKVKELNVQLGEGISLFQAGSNLFLNGVVLSVMYAGGKLISNHALSGGDLMSFLVAAQTIQRSLTNISILFGQFVRGFMAGARVFRYINLDNISVYRVIDTESANHEATSISKFAVQGDIEFCNVWFSYPTRSNDVILKNFSLKIPQGKVVAIVGASGSGKSTICNLLQGFYAIQHGEIKIDGRKMEDYDADWLYGKVIGTINQEPALFATTIMQNIRYGKPNATDDEVYHAAMSANAYGFINEFPEGFNTSLGQGGVTVSGGQKQRIAIARALIRDPKILILDEATSALDVESEKIVQKTLDSVVEGRTVLIIAHRLSTIMNADMIYVMENGSVAEMGTHEQLLLKKGLYYNMIRQQKYKS